MFSQQDPDEPSRCDGQVFLCVLKNCFPAFSLMWEVGLFTDGPTHVDYTHLAILHSHPGDYWERLVRSVNTWTPLEDVMAWALGRRKNNASLN